MTGSIWGPLPDQREVSRRAAERHAHLAVLEERRRAQGRRPRHRARHPRPPASGRLERSGNASIDGDDPMKHMKHTARTGKRASSWVVAVRLGGVDLVAPGHGGLHPHRPGRRRRQLRRRRPGGCRRSAPTAAVDHNGIGDLDHRSGSHAHPVDAQCPERSQPRGPGHAGRSARGGRRRGDRGRTSLPVERFSFSRRPERTGRRVMCEVCE